MSPLNRAIWWLMFFAPPLSGVISAPQAAPPQRSASQSVLQAGKICGKSNVALRTLVSQVVTVCCCRRAVWPRGCFKPSANHSKSNIVQVFSRNIPSWYVYVGIGHRVRCHPFCRFKSGATNRDGSWSFTHTVADTRGIRSSDGTPSNSDAASAPRLPRLARGQQAARAQAAQRTVLPSSSSTLYVCFIIISQIFSYLVLTVTSTRHSTRISCCWNAVVLIAM